MRSAGIDFLTIGQYLQPTRKHAAVDRFVTPDEFKGYETIARAKGFLMVSASPLTRSSYHAGDDFARLRDARELALKARPLGCGKPMTSEHRESLRLPYHPDDLFDLVSDVRAYPKFISADQCFARDT